MHPWEKTIDIKVRPLTNGQWIAKIVWKNKPRGKRLFGQANGYTPGDAVRTILHTWEEHIETEERDPEFHE